MSRPETPSGEHPGHRRASQTQTGGDLSRDHPPVSELHNLIDTRRSHLPGYAMRLGGTISQSLKPLLTIAAQPRIDGPRAHSQLGFHPDHWIAPLNSIHHQGSTMRATSCILMKAHPMSPFGAEGLLTCPQEWSHPLSWTVPLAALKIAANRIRFTSYENMS